MLASALQHAHELGNPELTAMMSELAGELGKEPCVPDLALAVLSNVRRVNYAKQNAISSSNFSEQLLVC